MTLWLTSSEAKFLGAFDYAVSELCISLKLRIIWINRELNKHYFLCNEPTGGGFLNSYIGDCDDDYGYDPDTSGSGYLDSTYQVIKWSPYNQKECVALKNEQLKDM